MSAAETQIPPHSSPSTSSSNDEYLTTKILVSLKEAACLIGPNGSKIQKVRDEYNVHCKLTPSIPKCSDRILTISSNVSKGGSFPSINGAIGECLQILVNEMPLSVESNSRKQYNYGPLNHILPVSEENCFKIGYLRLILNDNQISIIIGEKGSRIKNLLNKNNDNIKMLASKNYLPDSDDRILEIQGEPQYIVNVLNDIDSILMEINGSINNTIYNNHNSGSSSGSSGNNNNNNDNDNIEYSSNGEEIYTENDGNHFKNKKKHYYPHFNYSKTLEIPKEYVGSMMGRSGNRIISLKNFTNTQINISKEDPNELNRFFTISSDKEHNVEKAYTLLKTNYENIEKSS